MEKLLKFFKDEEGIVAIEYALLASLIALAIIVAVTLVGTDLALWFTNVADRIAAWQLLGA